MQGECTVGAFYRVSYSMDEETAALGRGFHGSAGDRDNLCLLFPDALPSYCFGSGLVILWLEMLPGKGELAGLGVH